MKCMTKLAGWKAPWRRYADEVYASLPRAEQEQVRRAFVQLVQPGQGTEDTRRVARRADLVGVNWGLVQHLADRRLVVTGQAEAGTETVEVVHEALIRGWVQLRGWMAADREFRTWQEGLRSAQRSWQASGRDEGALLRGGPLAQAEDWLANRGEYIGETEQNYIQASAELRARRQAERERRRQLTIGGLAVGLVIAVLLSVYAFGQRGAAQQSAVLAEQSAATAGAEAFSRATQQAVAEAEAQARATQQTIAEEQRQVALVQASIGLASQAELELIGNKPERAALLALEAIENYPYTWQAERALSPAVFNNHLRLILELEAELIMATWSPNGTQILTASEDQTARVWDAITGELIYTFRHDDKVAFAFWSPSGDRILTVGNDLVGKVWDAKKGELLFTLAGHQDILEEAGWNAAEDRIITTSADTTAKIWNANTGEEVTTFSSHNATVHTCIFQGCASRTSAWSPNGERVVTADEDGEIFIWDPESGEELLHLSGHEAWVNSVTWSPQGDRIASASDDGTARIWDATTGNQLASLDGHGGILGALWSPSGDRVLLNFNLEDLLIVWDPVSGEELVNFDKHSQIPWHAAWSADGSRIVSGSGGGSAIVWDSSTGVVISQFRGHSADVIFVDWSPEGDRVLTASQDGTVKVWSVAGQLTTIEISGEEGGDWAYDWSDDGEKVVRSYTGGRIKIFESATGEEILSFQAHDRSIDRAVFSPSGKALLTVARDDHAIVWNTETGEKKYEVDPAGQDGDWSPDGTRFATGSWVGSVRIWDSETGKELLQLTHNTGGRVFVRWSPDGQRVASIGLERTRIWDAKTGQLLLDINSGSTPPAWSPDSTLLASYSQIRGVIVVWDTSTGEELQSMTGHGSVVGRISWFPSGDKILAADINNEVKIWDVKTGSELANFTIQDSNGAWLSPDGHQILDAVWPNGPLIIFEVWQSLDELIDLAKDCCIFRELTPEERLQFGLPALRE